MQLNPASLFLLKKLSAKKRSENSSKVVVDHQRTETESRSHKARFQDWISPKPEAIQAFPGEQEIFRKGLVLVTDTRFVYIDPFDRMLKSYMFEHMVSVHKQFYKTTAFNRLLCKALLILCIIVFFIMLTIHLLDSHSSNFLFVYIPLFASILIGLKVWNDIKPSYIVHWRMRDHTYGEIVQEPLFTERLKGDTSREEFMNQLVNAMNQALSAKAWCRTQIQHSSTADTDQANGESGVSSSNKSTSPKLKLVTDSYR